MIEIKKEAPIFSVSQYVEFINDLVTITPVLVEGEVSNYRDIPGRNFCYFDIKDKNSAVKCFQGFWSSKKISLENGSTIRVFGYPTLQKNGSLVIDVREVFFVGNGVLRKRYEELKESLKKEGLFKDSYKKELPSFPGHIGLIAGKRSSAYHDVTTELSERWGDIKISFCGAKVQGINARKEIVDAIRYFNRHKDVDVLILARGGGSMEDLQAFDSEEVVREIFASKIPIISAIGHEDHWTLVDFVADVRAKTPTKAAQVAVPDKEEILERMNFFSTRSRSLLKNRLNEVGMNLDLYQNRLVSGSREVISMMNQELRLCERRSNEYAKRIILETKETLENYKRVLEALNPSNVLSRGFAIVEKEGVRISDINEVSKGDEVLVRLQNGEIRSKIQAVKKV